MSRRTPCRPVVRGKYDIGPRAVVGQHVVDGFAPRERIAHYSTTRRQYVVERRRRDFGRAQRALLGQIEHELGRRFGALRIDELERHAVDHARRSAPIEFLGGQNEADSAVRQPGTKPGSDVT